MKNITLTIIDSISSLEEVENTVRDFLYKFPKEINTIVIFNKEKDSAEGRFIYQKQFIENKAHYSNFCLNYLYRYVRDDLVFIIQTDSFIYNSNYWDDQFLEYDYIGAPVEYYNNQLVMNGGFSIRSRKLLERISQYNYNGPHPEDRFITAIERKELENEGFKFAPETLAQKFAYEPSKRYNIFKHDSFGVHGIRSINLNQ